MDAERKRKVGVRSAVGATAVALLIGSAGATSATAAGGAGPSRPCPDTFRVLHDDKIGKLEIPKGMYKFRVKRISCQKTEQNFKRFLNDPDGTLPNGWKVIASKQKLVNRKKDFAFRIHQVK